MMAPPLQWLHGRAVVVQGNRQTDSEFWMWHLHVGLFTFSGALYSPFGVQLKLQTPWRVRWGFVR
jgi:hypothetical protein